MEDVSYIIELMKKRSGIILTPDKSYLIVTKLYPLCVKYNCKNVDELVLEVKKNNPKLVTDVIDALLVNETLFFRDRYPFEALEREVIPSLLKSTPNKSSINILCAACSTGQEPYSLAMYFLEQQKYKIDFHITGIDISSLALEKAKLGIYNKFEVQRGLPHHLFTKYFTEKDNNWTISEKIKQHTNFYQRNLIQSLDSLGSFDIIFCRNVLIYFNEESRKQIINNLVRIMNYNSILILGGTENLTENSSNQLTKITHYNGIYIKNKN